MVNGNFLSKLDLDEPCAFDKVFGTYQICEDVYVPAFKRRSVFTRGRVCFIVEYYELLASYCKYRRGCEHDTNLIR